MNILAVDLGGTSTKFGRYEDDLLTDKGSFVTPKTYDEFKCSLLHIFNNFNETKPLDGLALSLPGAVDTTSGIIHGISAVPYIHGFNILKDLEITFKTKVTMENDANCAALGEMRFGAGRGLTDFVVMVVGSGLGGAIIINNQLVKGLDFFGGELGYMLVQDDFSSLSNLSSPVHQANEYSQQMTIYPPISGKELFLRADQGDLVALLYLEKIYTSLSKTIYNLIVTLNPQRFLIGGAISSREEFVPQLIHRTKAILNHMGIGHVTLDVLPCAFKNDANLMGAVAHFLNG